MATGWVIRILANPYVSGRLFGLAGSFRKPLGIKEQEHSLWRSTSSICTGRNSLLHVTRASEVDLGK